MNKTIIFSLSVLLILFSSLIAFGQSENNLITSNSVGDIKFGMTIGEVRKILPKNQKLGPVAGDENTWSVGIFEGDKLLLVIGYYDGEAKYEDDEKGESPPKVILPPIDENQKIEGIGIEDSRYKTAEGVHVGMTIADAEKKYGKLKEMFNLPHDGEIGKFTKQPKEIHFTFGIESEDVYTAGIYEEIPNCPEETYPPLCSVAKKYNQGAFIKTISILPPEKD